MALMSDKKSLNCPIKEFFWTIKGGKGNKLPDFSDIQLFSFVLSGRISNELGLV